MIKNLLLVGLGGGIGSVLRFGAGLLINSKYFPYATLAVNIIGSFIIGIVFAMSIKETGISTQWKLLLATGICGGFTTFSAFSMENLEFFQNGKPGTAIMYVLLSVVLGILAAFLGYQLSREW
jgi:CrcB protein